MKKRIHVNMHMIKKNRKKGEKNPVLTCKTYKRNYRVNDIQILGPSKLLYRPDKPLSCGATVWIETHSPVELDGKEIVL